MADALCKSDHNENGSSCNCIGSERKVAGLTIMGFLPPRVPAYMYGQITHYVELDDTKWGLIQTVYRIRHVEQLGAHRKK